MIDIHHRGHSSRASGSRRGLCYHEGFWRRPGPIVCPEGFTDTACLVAQHIAAVGRPSNTGGVEPLAELVAGERADRPIIIVGENDRKEDGSWPGRSVMRAGRLPGAASAGQPLT